MARRFRSRITNTILDRIDRNTSTRNIKSFWRDVLFGQDSDTSLLGPKKRHIDENLSMEEEERENLRKKQKQVEIKEKRDVQEGKRSVDQERSGRVAKEVVEVAKEVVEMAKKVIKQLQNLLPTIIAQVGNHMNNQQNNKNQDNNVINDNNQGNVRAMNNDRGLNDQMEYRSDGALYNLNLIWVPLTGDVRIQIIEEGHKSKYSVHPRADKMYYDLRDMHWFLEGEKCIFDS
uniref:Putative reverse transcriptase domain-containing protein n=1 Tax=Tanacetum cinerariifolium TaxID=118510 RepID=A0A699K3N4_TANCI|nr:putative reverse transcriptase domain-containing protein [Tanacetum cinerariifolium]